MFALGLRGFRKPTSQWQPRLAIREDVFDQKNAHLVFLVQSLRCLVVVRAGLAAMSSFRGLPICRWFVLAALLALCGCASISRIQYGAADAMSSRVLNLNELRRYADEPASTFHDEMPGKFRSGPLSYLALSGGGADGAYGAGVLNGWTAQGTRPEFSVVSGVSTGALIAPFAFLGAAYDATLRDVYTSGIAESILDAPNFLNALFGSGLFGNTRLRELVARYVNQDMLAAIAVEHVKGKRLFIVTTNLDTQRTVIWDMGRIASLRSPQAVNLFRDVLAASASIPVVFPPMLIDAEANGNRFQEMHVDGGVTAPCHCARSDVARGVLVTLRDAPQRSANQRSANEDLYFDEQQGGARFPSGAEQHCRHRRSCIIFCD
jgi:predicted patatin/cPLA2 family phospholipase